MTYLLDVNVLIALMDTLHVHHVQAEEWFHATGRNSWATCPITENGAIRVMGGSSYRNSGGNASESAAMMQEFLALPNHIFWADDISLLDSSIIDLSRMLAASQVTNSYLLALARAHGGMLATLDRKLIADAVIDGAKFIELIH